MRELYFVILGVLAGELSHFGRMITEHDRWPTWREIVSFTLQMGFIVLLAGLAVEQMDLQSELGTAVVAALMALSAREIIPWCKERAIKILEGVVFK